MVKKATILANLALRQSSCSRQLSSDMRLRNADAINKRNTMFTSEKARQAALVTRVQKIEVQYVGVPEPCTMVMNKDISTPYDCAKHLPERIRQSAVIAYVNGRPWDMHTPLQDDCELALATFKDPVEERIKMVNKVFWRSCSFLLGYVIERAFKSEHQVALHSWPAPSIPSGSFVYDAALSIANWKPTVQERRILSMPIQRLAMDQVPFERLEVDGALAKTMFEDNRFKSDQVEDVVEASKNNKVTLYRCGDHVDMSCGPMIADSSQVANFTVASVHPFETQYGLLYRFQGIAHPSAFTMSPFTKNVLEQRAQEMNTVGLPQESSTTLDEAEKNVKKELDLDHDEDHHTPKERQAAQ